MEEVRISLQKRVLLLNRSLVMRSFENNPVRGVLVQHETAICRVFSHGGGRLRVWLWNVHTSIRMPSERRYSPRSHAKTSLVVGKFEKPCCTSKQASAPLGGFPQCMAWVHDRPFLWLVFDATLAFYEVSKGSMISNRRNAIRQKPENVFVMGLVSKVASAS